MTPYFRVGVINAQGDRPRSTHPPPLSSPNMSTQKALAILEKNGPWGLINVHVDKPGPGEVLIRAEATALNPVDWKVQASGAPFVTDYPAIMGTDSAGTVVEIGEGVTRLRVGDRVFHQGWFTNRLATFKQFTISPADIVGKIPDNITFDQAASIPVGLGAAFVGLYGQPIERGGAGLVAPWQNGGLGKYAGQPIVVFGGSTSVGQYVIQLAKLSGFSPIITTSSPHNAPLVTSLGATHFISRTTPPSDVLSKVTNITSGGPSVKLVFDAISEETTQGVAYDVLAPGGTLVLVWPLKNQIDLRKRPESTLKTVVNTFGTVHHDVETIRDLGVQLYSKVEAYLASGDLKPNRTEILQGGLAGIPDGLERLRSNQVSGVKLVVRPHETGE
ncbi:GroES-like protein [Cristinia sonorae]|uniref:GroES-like protein n=1 Tax=Cristinia sonorae TaxID=1940300 RepID=A0A8K0UJ33_9AGAR|nr:GroES-like protein [Cristinia sonorae]